MDQLFTLTVPWYLLVLRSMLVYLFLFVLFRFAGRRQIGEFTNFDLVLVLILASAVGNALTGGDTTLLGGMISGGTIFVITVVVGRLTAANRTAAMLVEGKPQILVHHGVVDQTMMQRVGISHEDFLAAIREAGIASPEGVRYAVLETTGKLSVIGFTTPHAGEALTRS